MKIPAVTTVLQQAFVLALVGLLARPLSAAEIRGTVLLQQSGLFSVRGQAMEDQRIGIALWRSDAGDSGNHAPAVHKVDIEAGHVSPNFLLIRPGDRVRFVNRDPVEHQFFAQVPGARSKIDVRLKPDPLTREQTVTFNEPGTFHLFCRLHRRSYARIDVVEAPELHMIKPGEKFEFRNLQGGLWQMRVAGIGAETLTLETIAMISPPPLKLWLPVKSGIQPDGIEADSDRVTIEQLYPAQPGM